MAKKLYDLAVKTREYNDNEGNKKANWLNVGSVMQSDDGNKFLLVSRCFNPAGVPDFSGKGGDSVLVSMFEPRDYSGNKPQQGQSNQQPKPNNQGQGGTDNMDDDIPF